MGRECRVKMMDLEARSLGLVLRSSKEHGGMSAIIEGGAKADSVPVCVGREMMSSPLSLL